MAARVPRSFSEVGRVPYNKEMSDGFVYHRVPENLRGTVLYPLNMLKDVFPDIYTETVRKYEGREHVLETRIPPPLNFNPIRG